MVTNESVPAGVRESLNVESGLNDGICVPILFVFLSLAAGAGAEDGTSMLALKLVAQEIGIGIAVGFGLTALGGQLLKLCADRGWVSETWRQLLTLKNTVDILIGTLKPARRLRSRQRSCRFSRRARN